MNYITSSSVAEYICSFQRISARRWQLKMTNTLLKESFVFSKYGWVTINKYSFQKISTSHKNSDTCDSTEQIWESAVASFIMS